MALHHCRNCSGEFQSRREFDAHLLDGFEGPPWCYGQVIGKPIIDPGVAEAKARGRALGRRSGPPKSTQERRKGREGTPMGGQGAIP